MSRQRDEGRGPGASGEGLDPRLERLVALLYGELPSEEERQLRLEIESDPALRAEWEEISGARTLLTGWEITEKEPSFVFVPPEPSVARSRSMPRSAGWRDRLARLVPRMPWAIAATATAVAVLALSGARMETLDGGLALRFGRPNGPSLGEMAEKTVPAQSSSRGSTTPFTLPASGAVGMLGGGIQPVQTATPDGDQYMTREEFDRYAAGMTRAVVALLNEYSMQRDRELADLLRVGFEGFSSKQSNDYQELQGQIEAIRLGFAEEQFRTDSQLEYLLDQTQPGEVLPVSSMPMQGPEGVR